MERKRDAKGHFIKLKTTDGGKPLVVPKKKKGGGRPAGSKDKVPRKRKFRTPPPIPKVDPPAPVVPVIPPVPVVPVPPIAVPVVPVQQIAPPKSDAELFGKLPKIEEMPETEKAPPEPPKPGEGKNKTDDNPTVETDHRPLASMVWDSIIGFMVMVVGKFWLPRPFKKEGANPEAGEISYDEREMVIDKFIKYFEYIGMVALTPIQELWLAIFTYAMPRMQLTWMWLRTAFMKRAKPGPAEAPGDTRFAKTETTPPANPPAPGPEKTAPKAAPENVEVKVEPAKFGSLADMRHEAETM